MFTIKGIKDFLKIILITSSLRYFKLNVFLNTFFRENNPIIIVNKKYIKGRKNSSEFSFIKIKINISIKIFSAALNNANWKIFFLIKNICWGKKIKNKQGHDENIASFRSKFSKRQNKVTIPKRNESIKKIILKTKLLIIDLFKFLKSSKIFIPTESCA